VTTVAWDGITLAADSQTTLNGKAILLDSRKLCRLSDGRLVGFAGNTGAQINFEKWLEGEIKDYPKGEYSAVVINLDGSARCYENENDGGYWEVSAPFARGSGETVALTAMICGKNAVEAVLLATQIDIYTGGPVQYLTLEIQ
jgi:ATP-dependent protease HslVU (ClpYQ) peptidase subunit